RLIVKFAWGTGGAAAAVDESARLARLGPQAQAAGARVPVTLAPATIGGRVAMVQHALHGRCVAALLMERPQLATHVMQRVADWLESWSVATRKLEYLDSRPCLDAVDRIRPLLNRGDEYGQWMAACLTGLRGPLPMVAAHNDLTTWNLLLDEA